MSIQALRDYIARQAAAAGGLAALGATLDAQIVGVPLDPALAARTAELLAATGAPPDLLDGVPPPQARAVLAELRMNATLESRLMYAETRGLGWTHADPAVLQAAGDVSSGFVVPLSRAVVPALAGLAARLEAPGATFLDVGVGVAALAIAFARQWPHSTITGLDVWRPSLALARANVAAANLADRIELRELGVERLADERAYDLAWLPTIFVPAHVVRPGLANILRALRPGGWTLLNAIVAGGDPASAAMWRLRATMFGNPDILAPDLETALREAGFADVQTLPSPPGTFVTLVAGRRPA